VLVEDHQSAMLSLLGLPEMRFVSEVVAPTAKLPLPSNVKSCILVPPFVPRIYKSKAGPCEAIWSSIMNKRLRAFR